MSNFERDMANTMLDAADARIASLEADKADLLRVLGVADEKIRSGEDARGQYIRENAALEARCREAIELFSAPGGVEWDRKRWALLDKCGSAKEPTVNDCGCMTGSDK